MLNPVTSVMTDALSFYARPGAMTELGAYQPWLDDLPTDLAALCTLVQGLQVHVFWAERYGLQLDDARKAEVQLRTTTAAFGAAA